MNNDWLDYPNPNRDYPEPTDELPSMDEIEDMVYDRTEPRATDGCEPIEPDGICHHGYPSWLRYLRII